MMPEQPRYSSRLPTRITTNALPAGRGNLARRVRRRPVAVQTLNVAAGFEAHGNPREHAKGGIAPASRCAFAGVQLDPREIRWTGRRSLRGATEPEGIISRGKRIPCSPVSYNGMWIVLSGGSVK